MDIETLTSGLRLDESGIYVSKHSKEVSYPDSGHENCFLVEDVSFWFNHRNECIVSMIRNFAPPAGPLLDLGGGNGFVAQRLQTEGFDVILMEPGPVGAANAKRHRGIDTVVCSTFDEAGFKPNSLSAIGLFDVIEHVEDDAGFLDELVTALRPGGKIYMTVPCHQWLWSRADIEAGHFRRHTRRTMEALIQPPLHIEYFNYNFAPLVLPQYLLRALPFRLNIGNKIGVLSQENEHGSNDGLAVRAISSLLRREAIKIQNGQSIRFGASALVSVVKR